MNIRDRIKELRRVPADQLQPNPKNWRKHPEAQANALRGVLAEVGIASAVLARETPEGGLMLIDGHLRTETLHNAEIPVLVLDVTEEEADKILATFDPLGAMAESDADALRALLEEVETGSQELADMLTALAEDAGILDGEDAAEGEDSPTPKLADRFGVAPFSVLNARDGWWQERKRAWLALGITSEQGRGKNTLGFSDGCNLAMGGRSYNEAKQFAKTFDTEGNIAGAQTGTSIFDPVLCELAYSWFSPRGGTVIDPFAGGSVRGIVASKLGRKYVGHELRGEQVVANRQQAAAICQGDEFQPVWIEGDSRRIDKTCSDTHADMLLTCPPYANLEVYSDDPADISNMPYPQFLAIYREIIAKACNLLTTDSFAVCVVGEVRDKRGSYVDFVGDTVQAFRDAGLAYYNEAILVTAVGSLPIRVGKQFAASRKLGKTHQNVLVFVKGNGKNAAKRCGECDFADGNTLPEGDSNDG